MTVRPVLTTLTLRKRAGTQPWLTAFDLRRLALAVVERAAQPVARLRRRSCPCSSRTPACSPDRRRPSACRRSCRLRTRRTPGRRTGSCSAGGRSTTSRVPDDDAAVGRRDDVVERRCRCSPGSSETFGMRWNCTLDHDSANEQPCERCDAGELRDPRRLLARRLVVLEDALLDDQPLVGRHALVVPPARERASLPACGRPGCS